MSTPTPTLEQAVLDRLVEWGGEGLLARMIELFLEVAPTRIAEIEGAVASGDREAAARAAHSLKSSAGNLGAETLRRAAAELELDAGAADRAGFAGLAERTRLAYAEAEEALRGLRHSIAMED